MNNTHGDILYRPNTKTTANESTSIDLPYRRQLENTTAGSSNQARNNCPPRGEVGWICPVCGRGLAPSTSYCPCNVTREITYLNGGITVKDILDKVNDFDSTLSSNSSDGYYATTTTVSQNDLNF